MTDDAVPAQPESTQPESAPVLISELQQVASETATPIPEVALPLEILARETMPEQPSQQPSREAFAPEPAAAPPHVTPSASFAQPTPASVPGIVTRRAVAQAKRDANKREQFDRIVERAQKKGHVTNNDVQLLLGVSDATATRCLSALVKAGRLKRVGKQKRPTYELP